MRNKFTRSRFIEVLSETPLINHACKKTGIARSTVYRWLKDIPEFRNAVEDTLKIGRENVAEIAEGKLMKMIHEGNYKAIRYYLDNNSPRYMPKRTVFVLPPKEKHDFKPGERCEDCGETMPEPKNFREAERDHKRYSSTEYTEKDYDQYLHTFTAFHRCKLTDLEKQRLKNPPKSSSPYEQ